MNKKLFWLAFWVVGFAVFMTSLLLYFKYQAVYTNLQRDRVLMVVSEIDAIAEKNLSLGQNFWEIATLQDVIVRRREADRILIDIDVVGADGKIAYSTDANKLGDSIDTVWLTMFAHNHGVTSFLPDERFAVIASPIRNSFNQLVGYAVVRYSRDIEHAAMRGFAERLISVGLGVFIFYTLTLSVILAMYKNFIERMLKQAAYLLTTTTSQTHAVHGALAFEIAAINKKTADANQALASITLAPAMKSI